MSQRIYKYSLRVTDIQEIELPIDAKILSIQTQREEPCLWALVETENKNQVRVIEIIGTGNPIEEVTDSTREFIATFQMRGGEVIFHAFELVPADLPAKLR